MTEVDHLPRLSPGAQRMRRYRRRREAGQQCITLTLQEYQVWGLVACGFLDKDHRQDREAVADGRCLHLSDAQQGVTIMGRLSDREMAAATPPVEHCILSEALSGIR